MSDYPLSKDDQAIAAALAKKMLSVAKDCGPAITVMAAELVIDLVAFAYCAKKQGEKPNE